MPDGWFVCLFVGLFVCWFVCLFVSCFVCRMQCVELLCRSCFTLMRKDSLHWRSNTFPCKRFLKDFQVLFDSKVKVRCRFEFDVYTLKHLLAYIHVWADRRIVPTPWSMIRLSPTVPTTMLPRNLKFFASCSFAFRGLLTHRPQAALTASLCQVRQIRARIRARLEQKVG